LDSSLFAEKEEKAADVKLDAVRKEVADVIQIMAEQMSSFFV
jgi:hypothetical protein